MTKEKFEEASKSHSIQLGLDNREEILYHGFKFVKQDDEYDIVELTSGEYQVSVKNDLNKLSLFKTLPFTYVCDLMYSHSQTKRLLKLELEAVSKELSPKSKEDIREIKKRLRKSLNSFRV